MRFAKWFLALGAISVCGGAFAQEGKTPTMRFKKTETSAPSPSDVPNARPELDENALAPPTMTPELWLYLKEQQLARDPKEYRMRIAREKSAARRARMEAQKWYGISTARPSASPMPTMGTPANVWRGNTWDEYQWVDPYYSTRVAIFPNATPTIYRGYDGYGNW